MMILAGVTLLVSACFLVKHYLNIAAVQLKMLELPLTLKNIFFLSALTEAEARERVRIAQLADDRTLLLEEHGLEIYLDIKRSVGQGVSWEDAAKSILLRRTDGLIGTKKEVSR